MFSINVNWVLPEISPLISLLIYMMDTRDILAVHACTMHAFVINVPLKLSFSAGGCFARNVCNFQTIYTYIVPCERSGSTDHRWKDLMLVTCRVEVDDVGSIYSRFPPCPIFVMH